MKSEALENLKFFRSGEAASKFCAGVNGVKFSKPSARRAPPMSRYMQYAKAAGLSEVEIYENNHVVVWKKQTMTDKEALEHLIRLSDGGTNLSHDSNEACRIGAEALREREERNKGCDGCVHRFDVQVFEEPCLHCIRNAYELQLRDNYAVYR